VQIIFEAVMKLSEGGEISLDQITADDDYTCLPAGWLALVL